MVEILLGVLLGVILGTISGIIPGIHANTLAGVLLGLQVLLVGILGPLALAGTMFAALITHTFVDAIPSTFLGVPDTETCLSVLPAHALCLEGRGEEAVRIAALGSAGAIVLAVPLSVVCYLLLPALQPYLDWWIGVLLIGAAGYMIVTCDAPGWALGIFCTSGILGSFALHYSFLSLHTIGGGSAILMPLLSGLFGISVLLTATRGRIPDQRFDRIGMEDRAIVRCSVFGTGAGIAVGWLPGLSTASANGVLATLVGYEKDRRGYILATNAANTANAFIGLAALFALSRMRNGVMAALAQLPPQSLSALMVVGVLAAICAYLVTLSFSRYAPLLNRIDTGLLNRGVIAFIVILCAILTGLFGLFILILATAVGLAPRFINLPAVYCMGSIMVPVILYSFGILV